MPRGNPAVWREYGASYAQLSQLPPAAAETNSGRCPNSSPAGHATTRQPKGSGSFIAQTSWSLTGPLPSTSTQHHAPKMTEARAQFKPPPSSYTRRAPIKNDKDSFPVPSYPRDFQTCNKADYGADLTQHVRTKSVRPAESGPLLPQDAVAPQFTSQARADFPAHSREAVRELRSGRAGQSASHAPGYNIITGGNALGNNVFEQWQDTDYRRHR